jgi:hypothetical protein
MYCALYKEDIVREENNNNNNIFLRKVPGAKFSRHLPDAVATTVAQPSKHTKSRHSRVYACA